MFQNKQQAQAVLVVVAILLVLFLQVGVMRTPPYILILALMTLSIFFISFIKIDLALSILIFSMLLSPEFGLGGVKGRSVVLRFDDFFIFMLFFGWLARMAVNKEIGFLKITRMNKPILIYITICILSTVMGVLRGTTLAKYGFFYNLKYIEYFLLFFMVSNNIHSKKQLKTFIVLMLVVCVIVSLFSLKVAMTEGMRATAPFEGEQGEPNTLAGYLIVMMGITMGNFLHLSAVRARLFLGGFTAFMLAPMMYTLSRAGWLGSMSMFVSFLLFSKKGKGILLSIVLMLALIAPIVMQKMPDVVTDRYSATFRGGDTFKIAGKSITIDESASIRVRTWKKSLQMWSEYPLLGRGVPGGGVISDVQYTRVLREVGIFGFGAFVWIIVACFQTGWRNYNDPNIDDFGKGLSLGYLCSLMGLLAMGVAAEVFIIIRIMEPFWFLTAIIVALPEVYEQEALEAQESLATSTPEAAV